MHQYTKNELNPFINSAIIGTDAHTHSPLHKLFLPQFTTSLHLDIYLYIYPTPIYKANENLQAYRHHISPLYTLYNIKLSSKLSEMCSIPYEKFLPQMFH